MTEPATTLESARQLDQDDDLRRFRDQFQIPHVNDEPDLYFVGNSLGLMPTRTPGYVQLELDRWADLGLSLIHI